MTGFTAMSYYSPPLVLLLGMATLIGVLGIGIAGQKLLQLSLPSPWQQVIGVLLGIQVLSLAVQLVAMVGFASRVILISLWLIVVIGGTFACWRWLGPLKPDNYKLPQGLALLPLSIAIISLGINLLVALAPATKIDELHYHLLLPSRIVSDGALQFYRQPWEGAVYPQMLFQIATTPLHALNFPDAGNIFSWGLSLVLVWFAWYLIIPHARTSAWAYIWLATLVIGMYPVVWHVTSGAHAFGDLGTGAAIIALLRRKQLAQQNQLSAIAFIFSLGILSSVASKVSFLPLGIVLLSWSIFFILQQALNWRSFCQSLLYLLIPWLIFYLPILIWTWWQSGSAFGPMLSGTMGASIYDLKTIKEQLYWSRLANRYPLQEVIKTTLVRYSPLLFWGIISSFSSKSLPKIDRYFIIALLLLQSLLIVQLLPYDVRFLGGIIPGLAILWAMSCPPQVQKKYTNSQGKIFLIVIVLLLPWLGLQLYYGGQFVPVTLGLKNTEDFYTKYVAFYQDYQQLNQLLPNEAAILPQGVRINSVYAPRDIYLNHEDIPPQLPVFLFQVNQELSNVPQGYELGTLVYENKQAVVNTYRTPGSTPQVGTLQVAQLIHQSNSPLQPHFRGKQGD